MAILSAMIRPARSCSRALLPHVYPLSEIRPGKYRSHKEGPFCPLPYKRRALEDSPGYWLGHINLPGLVTALSINSQLHVKFNNHEQ